MRAYNLRFSDIGFGLLVSCAVITTILVARREFLQDSMATVANPQPTYLDAWEEALDVGIRAGSMDAPVQVVEFADFQCPYCASFETTVRMIREKYPDQVAFTFTPLVLPQHSFAEAAARAAECAHVQGRFEEMRSLLFEGQQGFGSVAWTDFAKQVRIADVDEFHTCVNDAASARRLAEGKKLADRLGVRGTPTIIVNGWKLPMTPSSEDFDRIVRNVLDGKPPAYGI